MKIAKMEVTLLDHCGNDLTTVNAARVSFAKESDWEVKAGIREDDRGILSQKDVKLIQYLAKHKHKSPFNHAFMSFRVKAPIFCARQMVKHEYLPWNEVSRRYVTDEPEFYFPDYWRKAADNVKQGSSDEKVIFENVYGSRSDQPEIPIPCTDISPDDLADLCLAMYQTMLKQGVCAEQARMVLPQNTMTEWIWSGTLFAFAKMCKLRLASHTQKETREIAQMIDKEASVLFPVSWKALMEYGE